MKGEILWPHQPVSLDQFSAYKLTVQEECCSFSGHCCLKGQYHEMDIFLNV
jgi:hypothetical protein